jgi:hypothetical protein
MTFTEEKIAELKAKHGTVIILVTEDDYSCALKDPIHDLTIIKAVVSALKKSEFDFVECLLANCWLEGDEIIKTEEGYVNELAEQLNELVDLPKGNVIRSKGELKIEFEGTTILCREAMRADIIKSEKRNPSSMPFLTAEKLLDLICLEPEKLDEIKQDTRKYIAFLTSVDKLKHKKEVSIKKY